MNKSLVATTVAVALTGLMAILMGAVGPASGPLAGAEDGLPGITKPSDDRTLSFQVPGRVVQVTVKEGDEVKAGQIVARLDDDVEKKALKSDEAKANDKTQIEAETAIRDQKKLDYDKIKDNVGATQFEKDAAKLEVTVAEARIKLAEFQHRLDGYKYEEDQAAMERRKVICPIDGIVNAPMILHEGEVAESQSSKIMRVIQIDPLYVEVMVPFAQAIKLGTDNVGTVTFSDKKLTAQGKVVYVNKLGDAASGKIMVRLEVPNKDKRITGETVRVKFGAAGVAKK